MLFASLWEMPVPRLEGFLLDPPPLAILLGYLYGWPFLFAPAFLWAFARECPRVRRRTGLDDLARRMVPASVGIGCLHFAAGAIAFHLAWAGYGTAALFVVLDGTGAAVNLTAFAAVGVLVLRARSAPADEARRVRLFSGAFLLYVGSALVYDVGETLLPGFVLTNFEWTPHVLFMALLRFPGMLLLWYSVLAVRVPHPREVVRAFYRRLLMRRGLLGAAAAAPAVALGWLLASRPERAVGAVLTDPLAQALFAAAGIMLLVVVVRERLLIRLDTWVYPETADQRRALATAAAALAQVSQTRTIGRTLTRTVNQGCGSPATLLVASDAEASSQGYEAPDAAMPPLSRESAIVHMLERAGGSLRVHPSDAASLFELLPRDDAAWVAETGADAVVAVLGPGAQVTGVLVVGRRFDDRTVRPVDVPFLEALAAAAGLALARLRSLDAPAAEPSEGMPARACPACGSLAAAGEPVACGCGADYVEAEVPTLLAGKYRLTRRLGTGGTGEVYLARDLRLQRDVAVKTLSGKSVRRLMALRPEAWTMATVTHPAAAQIHDIEFWRGRSFLVVEFLAGGTLADWLRDGPFPAARAAADIATLADALAALHDAGYLHRDIKPGNIAFTADGLPKLLDFGLSREEDDATLAGGTPQYSSPEVLSGRPAGQADDVWSLCVVLYEMVAGRHPFAGTRTDAVTDRILRQRIAAGARPESGSEPPPAVLGFAASVLTAKRASRPATARALADALRRMLEQGG